MSNLKNAKLQFSIHAKIFGSRIIAITYSKVEDDNIYILTVIFLKCRCFKYSAVAFYVNLK
jgi:hypothetical protein